jgi:DNA-binding transcriptional regulator YiaG
VNLYLLYSDADQGEIQCTVRTIGLSEPRKMTNAVARIIEELRSRGGLKETDVANIASVSPATVSRWIAGKALPDPQTQLIVSHLR